MNPTPAPHDPWAERFLIGALTYRPSSFAAVYEAGLEPGHYYHTHHRRQYGQLYDHWIAGTDPDPGLTRDATTGPAYDAPQISNPDEYVRIILDCARRRRQIDDALSRPHHHIGWAEWAAAKG